MHLNTINVIGGHEIGADEQENNLSSVEVLTDLPFPFCPCANITVMPHVDKPLAFQRPQVALELVKQVFIFVRITEEDVHRHERTSRLFCWSLTLHLSLDFIITHFH